MLSYNQMILDASDASAYYNIAAAALLWIMLAGILVLPGTFTTLQKSDTALQNVIQYIPLLPVAIIFYLSGMIGVLYLWNVFRGNYIWLIQHLFQPGTLNTLTGLVTVIINIYTARNGTWSPTAWATLAIVVVSFSWMMSLLMIYKLRLMRMRNAVAIILPN
ncbi:hypothetical protein BD289DRAFT_368674 [Coniella lustricola]|uniref:Uncharacterized protein n=1 Tax=Coniella lustricola TaxID=2025994 RepID=A0A2T3A7S0_9PEZI|nr:hypothetical protein BD289DRAFT_368674 [Coniella lustricola]